MSDPNEFVLARRKAGWPPVRMAAREDVMQPLQACDCHPNDLLWHPGEAMYVRRAELDAGREDIEPMDDEQAQGEQQAVSQQPEPAAPQPPEPEQPQAEQSA